MWISALPACASRNKDYRLDGAERYNSVMTLDTGEFIRRFLMHVLPSGFHRIRYYGFLTCQTRANNIEGTSKNSDLRGFVRV